MRIDIFTLFPGMFTGPFEESIIKRAVEREIVNIHIHNIREYATDKHHVTDDYPYGGGPGMVMKPEPIFAAVESVREQALQGGEDARYPVILMTPQGRVLSQKKVDELAQEHFLAFICGHYEGVDERVREHLVTDEISIGDYVLSGGELPAMVVVDAVVRRLPGALGSELSVVEESFAQGLLEYPHYTRPPEFRGWVVPEILLSGNHGAIARWRRERSLLRTWRRRPDLLEKVELTPEDRKFLERIKREGISSADALE